MDILVVDASEHIRTLVGRICSARGWSYHVTDSMADASEVLDREPVQVVLIADHVHGSWGGTLREAIPPHQTPFLVGFATHTDRRMWERWSAQGCQHLLDKQTIQKRELEQFLYVLLSRPRAAI